MNLTDKDNVYIKDADSILNNKIDIGRDTIANILMAYYKNKRNATIAIGVMLSPFLLIIALCSISFPPFSVTMSILLVITLFATIYFATQADTRMIKVESLDFFVTSDTCVSKEVKIGFDDEIPQAPDTYYLNFSKFGKYRIDFKHVGYLIDSILEKKLYDAINVNDVCYIVMLDGDPRIRLALDTNKFRLIESEFIFTNGVYKPIGHYNPVKRK